MGILPMITGRMPVPLLIRRGGPLFESSRQEKSNLPSLVHLHACERTAFTGMETTRSPVGRFRFARTALSTAQDVYFLLISGPLDKGTRSGPWRAVNTGLFAA